MKQIVNESTGEIIEIYEGHNVPIGASPFKTPWNAQEFPAIYEVNKKPSLTVPDQTMSIKTILDRFSKGLPIDGPNVPVYHGEEDFIPDWERLDLSERADLRESVAERIREIQNELAEKTRPKPDEKPSPKDEVDPNQLELPISQSKGSKKQSTSAAPSAGASDRDSDPS